jgi:hypothetical protein
MMYLLEMCHPLAPLRFSTLHIESPTLSMSESIIQTSSLVDLCLPFFVTHESTCYTHISLVVPDSSLVFFCCSFLFVLVK